MRTVTDTLKYLKEKNFLLISWKIPDSFTARLMGLQFPKFRISTLNEYDLQDDVGKLSAQEKSAGKKIKLLSQSF